MTEDLFERYRQLKICENEINAACEKLVAAFKNGNKLLICGNGGSCADCGHITGELMKGFLNKRPIGEAQKAEMRKNNPDISEKALDKLQMAVPCIPLPAFTALSTAFCNDVDSSLVYAQTLMGLGKKGDILLCISTSGNSENVVYAAETAKALGLSVISLAGKTGGGLKSISDVCIAVPENETYKVQELHLPVYHHICAYIEDKLFHE